MTRRENVYGKETYEKFTEALSVKRLQLALTLFSLRFPQKLATCFWWAS
jgi:hypothetical protein